MIVSTSKIGGVRMKARNPERSSTSVVSTILPLRMTHEIDQFNTETQDFPTISSFHQLGFSSKQIVVLNLSKFFLRFLEAIFEKKNKIFA